MKCRWRILRVSVFAIVLSLLPIGAGYFFGEKALNAWSFWLLAVLGVALQQTIAWLQEREQSPTHLGH